MLLIARTTCLLKVALLALLLASGAVRISYMVSGQKRAQYHNIYVATNQLNNLLILMFTCKHDIAAPCCSR